MRAKFLAKLVNVYNKIYEKKNVFEFYLRTDRRKKNDIASYSAKDNKANILDCILSRNFFMLTAVSLNDVW